MSASQSKTNIVFVMRFILLYGIIFLGFGWYTGDRIDELFNTSVIDLYFNLQFGIWLLVCAILGLVILKAVGYLIVYDKHGFTKAIKHSKYIVHVGIWIGLFVIIGLLLDLILEAFVIKNLLINIDKTVLGYVFIAVFLATLFWDINKNRDKILQVNI